MIIGYARTSTGDQQAGLEDQIAELKRLGAGRNLSRTGFVRQTTSARSSKRRSSSRARATCSP